MFQIFLIFPTVGSQSLNYQEECPVITINNSDTFQSENLTLSSLTLSNLSSFWHFPILTLSSLNCFWHFPISAISDTFQYQPFLTLSNSDIFQSKQVLALSNSDTFQTEQFLTLSNSDTFRFWPFPILTLSNFAQNGQKMDSDTFQFWHFPISHLRLSSIFLDNFYIYTFIIVVKNHGMDIFW